MGQVDGGEASGLWSVHTQSPNVITVIWGDDPNQSPNDWNFVMLLDGDFEYSGEILLIDAMYDPGINSSGFIYNNFYKMNITPN